MPSYGPYQTEETSGEARVPKWIRIYQQLILNMENKKINNSLVWVSSLPEDISVTLSEFLSPQDLQVIKQAYSNSSMASKLGTLASTKSFINKYINKADRSLYMSFYSEPEFIRMQLAHCSKIDGRKHDPFQKFDTQFSNIFQTLEKELRLLERFSNIKDELQLALCDAEMPFPKMRKQGIGMFCNSNFQFFLVDQRFGLSEPQVDDCFLDLKNFVEAFRETTIETQLSTITENEQKLRIFHTVRYTPDIITPFNYKHFLITDDLLNNLVVLIFAMTSGLVKSMEVYIDSFHDPIAVLVEVLLRYNMFKSYVLSIEEKCSFIFENYDKTAELILGEEDNEPQFCFWRPAMTMWYQTMKKHHETLNEVYSYLITKIRMTHLVDVVTDLLEQVPSAGISIKNTLSLREFQLTLRETVFGPQTQNTGIENYFESNPDLYDQLCREYLEYTMDLSVNELTVHWCGHSQHALDEPYLQFEDYFMDYTENYYAYLQKAIFAKHDGPAEMLSFREILDQELSFLGKGYVKPITLRKIATHSNELISAIMEKQSQSLTSTNNSLTPSLEEPMSPPPRVNFTTKEQDNILTYYNNKHEPSKTTGNRSLLPMHENLNCSQRMLFSISATTESKMMFKSLDIMTQSIKIKNPKSQLLNPKCKEKSFEEIVEYFSGSSVEEIDFDDDEELTVFGTVTNSKSEYLSKVAAQETETLQEMCIKEQLMKGKECSQKKIMSLFPARLSRESDQNLEDSLDDDQLF